MAENLGKLVIAITATTKGLQTAATKTKGILTGLGKTATSLPGLLTGYGVARGAQSLLKLADSYQTMGDQLLYIAGNAQDAEFLQEDLYKIAKATGTTIDSNVGAYIKLNQAQKLTGLSSQENIQVLGAINALMIKTGTSGGEASAAMLQLGQALTSGKLAGDEFKSLAENAPGLLNAMAEAMGLPREELKQLAADGEITSERMGQALLKIAESGEVAFEDLPKTTAKGWNAVVLSFSQAWDKINDETGFIGMIHDALLNLAGWIEDNQAVILKWARDGWDKFIEAAPTIIATAKAVGETIEWLSKIVVKAVEGWKWLIETAQAFFGVAQAADDLRRQQEFVDNAKRESGYDTTPAAAAGLGGGSTINNIFTQKLSRGDITDITVSQGIQAARL